MPKILVVDDVYTVRLKIELVLQRVGNYSVQGVASGSEALTAALGEPLDLIVMDIIMADMSGLTALRTLRAAGLTCPVIAHTARAEQFPGEFILFGFAAYVPKAASLHSLVTVVQRLLDPPQMPGLGAGTSLFLNQVVGRR